MLVNMLTDNDFIVEYGNFVAKVVYRVINWDRIHDSLKVDFTQKIERMMLIRSIMVNTTNDANYLMNGISNADGNLLRWENLINRYSGIPISRFIWVTDG